LIQSETAQRSLSKRAGKRRNFFIGGAKHNDARRVEPVKRGGRHSAVGGSELGVEVGGKEDTYNPNYFS